MLCFHTVEKSLNCPQDIIEVYTHPKQTKELPKYYLIA